MNRLLFGVLVVILVGVIAVASLFSHYFDPVKYWGSIIWIMALVVANWLTHALVLSGKGDGADGAPGNPLGALPGIGVVVFCHSILSMILLAAYLIGMVGMRFHLAGQISAAVVAAVIVLLALVAAKGAAHGAESVVSQTQLINGLKRLQRLVERPDEKRAIQQEINYVQFQMPHTSKLDSSLLVQVLGILQQANKETAADDLEFIRQTIRSL